MRIQHHGYAVPGGRNLCHHSIFPNFARNGNMMVTPMDGGCQVNQPAKEIRPAGTTLLAKLSLPIIDRRLRFVDFRRESHRSILTIRSSSLSGGSLATITPESSSIPKKVRVVAGPTYFLIRLHQYAQPTSCIPKTCHSFGGSRIVWFGKEEVIQIL